MAHGKNALLHSLSDGSEIVIYAGTGRGPLGSSQGALYAMKDSVIIKVGQCAAFVDETCES